MNIQTIDPTATYINIKTGREVKAAPSWTPGFVMYSGVKGGRLFEMSLEKFSKTYRQA